MTESKVLPYRLVNCIRCNSAMTSRADCIISSELCELFFFFFFAVFFSFMSSAF